LVPLGSESSLVSYTKPEKIFRPKTEEVIKGRGKLPDEQLDLYSAPDIIKTAQSRRMRWEGHVECMSQVRNAYKHLIGNHEGKTPLDKSKFR
jgi:hypothetical protein